MVQEVTTQSWFSRIKSAVAGIFVGFICIIGSFWLIFWNESHGLHTSQSLEQTEKVLITVPNAPVNEGNEGKVVHTSGLATTDDTITDHLIGLTLNAIKLERFVEMYQWKENVETSTESEMGGSEKTTKTYTYEKTWSDELINSGKFKEQTDHHNPTRMPFETAKEQARVVTLGDFYLPPFLVEEINDKEAVDISKVNTTNIQSYTSLPVHQVENGLYFGKDPNTPEVGDLRLHIFQVKPQDVSIIAQQLGNTFQRYMAPAGKPVALIEAGELSPQEMIRNAQSENNMMMWIWRCVSFILMVVGIGLILKPLVILADIIPFLGTITGFGTGFIAFFGGFILWSSATAIAWLFVRPLFSIGLIIVIVGICAAVIWHRKRKQTV